MKPEQVQRQLEKYRKQERTNKVILYLAAVVLGAIALSGLAVLLVKLLRPTPTFTPSALVQEMENWRGQKVRVKGKLQQIAENDFQIRVRDPEKSDSIFCRLTKPLEGWKDGEDITVQGRVDPQGGLIDCEVIED
jgi:hypothetical protein